MLIPEILCIKYNKNDIDNTFYHKQHLGKHL